MRRTITLKPNENYSFDIGRMSLILIIRDATRNVIFYGDSISEIELSRSDIVAVVKYQQQRVFLRNDNDVDITVEFQLSDVQISIREQRMALDGGVVVEEITTPIQVSEIQAPVKVSGVVPVSIDKAVPVLLESVAVSNFPDVQRVIIENSSESGDVEYVKLMASSRLICREVAVSDTVFSITAQQNLKRKSITIQPDVDIWVGNDDSVKLNGIKVVSGGSITLETTSLIITHGSKSGKLRIMEEVY